MQSSTTPQTFPLTVRPKSPRILQSFLSKLDIGMAGDSTAIGSAVGIAVKRLKDLESDSKVIILLTDGRNNAGSLPPIQAAQTAKAFGIKIHTIRTCFSQHTYVPRQNPEMSRLFHQILEFKRFQ